MAYVFAYGSNLDVRQMRKRCPSAEFVGVATMPRQALAFVGHSRSRNGAVATIVPARSGDVPGVVWDISNDDLRILDAYEGVPLTYQRFLMRAVLDDGHGVRVFVYLHRSTKRTAPSLDYFRLILAAYGDFNFDIGVIERALADSGVINRKKRKRS